MRAECGSCHGSTASVTGDGVRFDFYDWRRAPAAWPGWSSATSGSAVAQRDLIARAITTTDHERAADHAADPGALSVRQPVADDPPLDGESIQGRQTPGQPPAPDQHRRHADGGRQDTRPVVSSSTIRKESPSSAWSRSAIGPARWTAPVRSPRVSTRRRGPRERSRVSAVLCDGWQQSLPPSLLTVSTDPALTRRYE